jgi:small subunit ribosomal protein S16
LPVRIRMKKMGRRHRPFYRICAVDGRRPRDGRVLEELGTYDTSLADTDARTLLKNDRVDYWISVGAQPSDKVGVLIKKYGTDGTRVEQAIAARENLSVPTAVPPAPEPVFVPKEPEAEAPAAEPEAAPADAPAAEGEKAEAPAKETAAAPAAKEAPAEEAPAAEASAEEAPAAEAPAEEEKPAE